MGVLPVEWFRMRAKLKGVCMPVVILDEISLNYGEQILLDKVTLQIDPLERICIVGRNGAGKSSLMKIVQGALTPDGGVIRKDTGIRIAELPQVLPAADERTVEDVVLSGLAEVGAALRDFNHLAQSASTDADMKELERLQHIIEANDGWLLQQKCDSIMERLQLPKDKTMAQLSGGWRRRVMLGRALISEPDLLLLDEPTNHLDIPAIEWLETQLREFRGAVLFITHDRAFMEKVATAVVDLDRGHLHRFKGSNYEEFIAFREKRLADEDAEQARFDKHLAQEEIWIRQGIKARRTRNEGRVRALEQLRRERSERRDVQGKAGFTLDAAIKSGKLVVDAEHIDYGYDGKLLIKDFSAVLQRGDKIGLLGTNGCGKSTLLKLLQGDLQPQAGFVKQGTKLEVAYFDQLRGQLDMEKNIIDNLSEGREFIEIGGQNRHILSYLGDFLFSPQRARTPVKALSGGECSRVMLAKLFSKPSNMLILDEPTNDLDVETLELLEQKLIEYPGTILIVSHDRAFLNNVVTGLWVFEGAGLITDHVGGYNDWYGRGHRLQDAVGKNTEAQARQEAEAPQKVEAVMPVTETPRLKKLSYKLQRELDELPGLVEKLEAELARLNAEVASADFYTGEHAKVAATLETLEKKQAELDIKMERWLELEAMQEGS